MVISTGNPGLIYSLFYMLAFATAGILLVYTGARKKYPIGTWLVIILFIILSVILGDKLLTTTPGEWRQFFNDFRLPDSGRKSVLGGISGLIIGIVILKFLFRFRFPIADHFAYILPVTIGIARFGCLFAGCCHGSPTDMPWGMHYGEGTIPFNLHLGQGMIDMDHTSSLAVHPTQLYDIIFCVLTVFLIWRTQKYWKANGSKLVFAALCYGGFRFIEEFFRDGAAYSFFGETYMGLKIVQWLILGGIVALAFFLVIRERRDYTLLSKEIILIANPFREFIILGIVLIFFLINIQWFSVFEISTLMLFLVPAMASFLFRIYKHLTIPQLRWIVPALLISGLLFMGQSYIPKNKDEKVNYYEIGIGGLYSKYHQEVRQHVSDATGCDGDAYAVMRNDQMRNYSTAMGGLEMSYHSLRSKYTHYQGRWGVFFGNDQVTCDTTDLHLSEFSYGIHTAGYFDWKFFGFGLGFRLGRQRLAIYDKSGLKIEIRDWENEMGEYIFLPISYIRVGPPDIIYAEGNIGYFLPSGASLPFYSAGLGSGLGKNDGTLVGAGYSDAGYYLKGAYAIKERHILEAFYSDKLRSGYSASRVFSVGYRYRFKFSTLPIKKIE